MKKSGILIKEILYYSKIYSPKCKKVKELKLKLFKYQKCTKCPILTICDKLQHIE